LKVKAQSRRGRFAQTHIKWLSPCYANPSWCSGTAKCASRRYTRMPPDKYAM